MIDPYLSNPGTTLLSSKNSSTRRYITHVRLTDKGRFYLQVYWNLYINRGIGGGGAINAERHEGSRRIRRYVPT